MEKAIQRIGEQMYEITMQDGREVERRAVTPELLEADRNPTPPPKPKLDIILERLTAIEQKLGMTRA